MRRVVRVLDKDRWEGHPYCVTEYVDGVTLSEAVAQAPAAVRWSLVVGWLEEIAAALDVVHQGGVVHRDIKPENILVGHDGHAKLTDFGVARVPGSDLTKANVTVGTPGLLAPEQLQGAASATPASDQWSLAAVVYWMLCGLVPGQRPGEEQLTVATVVGSRVLAGDLLPLRMFRSDLPKPVLDAVERALAQDAAGRFPKVGAFTAALSRTRRAPILLGESSPALAAAAPSNARRTGNRRGLALAASLVVAAGLGGGVWMWQSRKQSGAAPAPSPAQRAAAVAKAQHGVDPGAPDADRQATPPVTPPARMETRILALEGEAQRDGVALEVNGEMKVAPALFSGQPGDSFEVRVTDPQFESVSIQCRIDAAEPCVVQVRARPRGSKGRRPSRPSPDEGALEEVIDVVRGTGRTGTREPAAKTSRPTSWIDEVEPSATSWDGGTEPPAPRREP